MRYEYGTSGFRYHHKKLKQISMKIGMALAILSNKKNKYIGVMITASHNQFQDNGVKIIDYNGEMINENDESFLVNYVNNTTINIPNYNAKIIIGMDTRESSPEIKQSIISGVRIIDSNSLIIDLGLTTTPQLHYLTKLQNECSNLIENSIYYNSYFNNHQLNLNHPVIIDCANGVGFHILDKIKHEFNLNEIILKNTKTYAHHLLNLDCGSDYVQNNHIIPFNLLINNQLCCSLDGDADRIVFYFLNDDKFYLLDGDSISALIAYFICKYIDISKIDIAVIHTSYSSINFIKYINTLGIKTVCTATGVKNLHKEASKYDIGIYFEYNGHGTVLIKNSKNIQKLSKIEQNYVYILDKLFSSLIGDAIYDLFAVIYIIRELNIKYIDWYNLYDKNYTKNFKIKVKNKNIFKTNNTENKLTDPIGIQEYLEKIMKKYNNVYTFIRPSGTEDIIRLHIQADTEEIIEHIFNDITSILINEFDVF